MLMPPPGTDQGSRCVAALICGRMMATASPFSVLRHRDAPHFDERALRNNNALKRWTWTTRMSASVEIVRSDSPQRLALMEESAELKRLKRENGELCSAAPISTVNPPGLVDDTTATGPGVVATTKASKAYPLSARIRVRDASPTVSCPSDPPLRSSRLASCTVRERMWVGPQAADDEETKDPQPNDRIPVRTPRCVGLHPVGDAALRPKSAHICEVGSV